MIMRRRQKGLNGFKVGTFTGRFPSDGAASMAMKGLMNAIDEVNKERNYAFELYKLPCIQICRYIALYC